MGGNCRAAIHHLMNWVVEPKWFIFPTTNIEYMTHWECGIDGCGTVFETPEDAIIHQTTEHQRTECKVCNTIVPDGYFAIRHAFTEHSRAEYVRAYNATADDIRQRENIKDKLEAEADLDAVVAELDDTDHL